MKQFIVFFLITLAFASVSACGPAATARTDTTAAMAAESASETVIEPTSPVGTPTTPRTLKNALVYAHPSIGLELARMGTRNTFSIMLEDGLSVWRNCSDITPQTAEKSCAYVPANDDGAYYLTNPEDSDVGVLIYESDGQIVIETDPTWSIRSVYYLTDNPSR